MGLVSFLFMLLFAARGETDMLLIDIFVLFQTHIINIISNLSLFTKIKYK